MLRSISLLVASQIAFGINAPFQLVNRDGVCKSSKQLQGYISGFEKVETSTSSNLISVVDCNADSSQTLVNGVFGTSFEAETGKECYS